MAPRKTIATTPGSMPECWKEKIKASMLTNRLMQCAVGEIEMTAQQIKAADILLKKVAPDLARTEHTGKDGGAIETKDITKTDAQILAEYLGKK